MKLKGKYIVLTKIEDLKFNGNHPNNINVGSKEIQGYCHSEPEISEQLTLHYNKVQRSVCAWTSEIVNTEQDGSTCV